jgi:hypothetical protein
MCFEIRSSLQDGALKGGPNTAGTSFRCATRLLWKVDVDDDPVSGLLQSTEHKEGERVHFISLRPLLRKHDLSVLQSFDEFGGPSIGVRPVQVCVALSESVRHVPPLTWPQMSRSCGHTRISRSHKFIDAPLSKHDLGVAQPVGDPQHSVVVRYAYGPVRVMNPSNVVYR